jgi:hypothetical protein
MPCDWIQNKLYLFYGNGKLTWQFQKLKLNLKTIHLFHFHFNFKCSKHLFSFRYEQLKSNIINVLNFNKFLTINYNASFDVACRHISVLDMKPKKTFELFYLFKILLINLFDFLKILKNFYFLSFDQMKRQKWKTVVNHEKTIDILFRFF